LLTNNPEITLFPGILKVMLKILFTVLRAWTRKMDF
jgi:hypothetical protein